jgi:Protein of unknown function (DUF2911)
VQIRYNFAMSLLAMLAVATVSNAQGGQPSPPATADVTLAGKTVTIKYSRPSMRGRKIMGELVPYGQVWRTGANEATTLTSPVALKIGNVDVAAGEYTLWTLPSEGTWKLIINKETGQWGTNYNGDRDLGRADMQKAALDHPVEQFLISWKKESDRKAELVLEWERTRVWVPVEVK